MSGQTGAVLDQSLAGQTDDQEEVQTSKIAVFISLLMMQIILLGS